MAGSILIIGSNQKNREKKAESLLKKIELTNTSSNPDIFEIEKLEDKKSIGIDQIREGIAFLAEKPFSHKNKAIVINRAHLLTLPAQNALLKTLEEPPEYATVILCAKTENDLVETILSRCKKIDISREQQNKSELLDVENTENIVKILEMTPGERLTWAETFAKNEKDDIVNLLETWILQLRNLLGKENPAINVRKMLEITQKVRGDLANTNLNKRLAIECLLLHIDTP
jgi:DNA polymerase III gamma/tau subunit